MAIKKHIKYLKKDTKGELNSVINSIFLIYKKVFWSFLNRIKCSLIGIKCEKGIIFIGNTIFNRKPLSSISIGKHCILNSSSHFNLIGVNHGCIISTHSEFAKISIGNNCGFSGTVIGSYIGITIGNNVLCGANTLITDFDWHTDDPRSGNPQEVIIEDNVWLGLNCVVLKGVRIGRNSLIGANSLVTKDIPENSIAAGNPCKIIQKK